MSDIRVRALPDDGVDMQPLWDGSSIGYGMEDSGWEGHGGR